MRALTWLTALVALAAMFAAGVAVGNMNERPVAPFVDFRKEKPRPAIERLPAVRRIDCERTEDLVGLTAVCT